MDEEINELTASVLNTLGHHQCSRSFQGFTRNLAKIALSNDREQEGIYYLVDSHSPYYRLQECEVVDKDITSLNKNHLRFPCSNEKLEIKLKDFKNKIKELPEEWTILHLTPENNIEESVKQNQEIYHNTPLFLTVYNCGKTHHEPICVSIDIPREKTGEPFNSQMEFRDILSAYSSLYRYTTTKVGKNNAEKRVNLDHQLKKCIMRMSTYWLRHWKCFMFGSFVSKTQNELVHESVQQLLKKHSVNNLPERNNIILQYIFKSIHFLSQIEIKRGLLTVLTEKYCDIINTFMKDFVQVANEKNDRTLNRNPLILILDDTLEAIPWEMFGILENQPVTRMPSFHFTYALFKHYEHRIVDGYLTGINHKSGAYLINPGKDLPQMETRLKSFFSYYMTSWEGIVGRAPKETEYQTLLEKSDVFVYNGHGDGRQFLSGDKIRKMHFNSIVFLFGCSSVGYRSMGPRCAMASSQQYYLSACCPCMVGMLYIVTDRETDLLSTKLLATWLPAMSSWNSVDKKTWLPGKIVQDIEKLPIIERQANIVEDSQERNLPLAVAKVKKSFDSMITKSAFVVRGLPVKL